MGVYQADASWWKQLLPYTLAVISLKVVALLPLLLPATSTALLSFAHLALDYLPSALQVVFAMALFPIIMNVFQFCVVDQIIKSSQGSDKNDAERSNLDYSRIPLCDVETSGASTELGSTGVQRYAFADYAPEQQHDRQQSTVIWFHEPSRDRRSRYGIVQVG